MCLSLRTGLGDNKQVTMLPVTNSSIIAARAVQRARERARSNYEGLMTAQVRITRRSTTGVNAQSGSIQAVVDHLVYEGPARLVSASGPVTYTVGEEVQFFSSSYAYLPVDDSLEPVVVQVNDFLEVLAHDDPGMAGRRFRVVDVESSGFLAVSRRIQLVGIQPYPGWTDTTVRIHTDYQPPDVVPQEWSV